MDTIEITSLLVDGWRLDFPSEKQIAALASAWDDETNHQVCFLRNSDFHALHRVSEYASMVASADLVLAISLSLSKIAAEKIGATRTEGGEKNRRSIRVGEKRREYLSFFEPLDEDKQLFREYAPLKTLALFLSALEQRRGSVFLVGGNLPTLQKAEANVRSTFPELRVVGRAAGDYREEDETAIMRALQKSTPDMIIVGSPVKDGELWIPRHMRYTKAGIFLYEADIMEILAGKR
ncbi:MAG TPA: WecB/TagA/CpsF family glycosyltransferase [Rectinemataceae bacterium]|nr:WecB/TagA/CpsF family glycosyltransferase [Rectinemataceae bacterium]